MKSRPTWLVLLPLQMLLSGCVGYNTTLFSTKSNFGLDLDTTPPTAEISVSRREGVIAPSFEGGKTPPIMASFKVEQNGLATFFNGVGQTFAGGDSAMALSMLYDEGTPPGKDPAPYDSTLTLKTKPTYKTLFSGKKDFPEESRVRPFVFATDTSLGVKVAWSGMTAQFPDSVKVGFNRKEFALAPVNLTQPGDYAVDMPSFLATIDTKITVGAPTNSGLRSLQYFATGTAATQLAMESQVRKAMLYDADPTIAAKARAFGGQSEMLALRLLGPMYGELSGKQGSDANAKKLVAQLDAIVDAGFSINFTNYNFIAGTHVLSVVSPPSMSTPRRFLDMITYATTLDKSSKSLLEALTDTSATFNGITISTDQALKDVLTEDYGRMVHKHEALKADLKDSAAVINRLVEHFYN